MVERRWREDLTTTFNLALRNQQDSFSYYWDNAVLRDRVERSTPPPELTETLARKSTLFFLAKAKKTTHWGVLTRATYWPPRTGTPLKIDAIGLRRLVEVSTIPVFLVVVLYCIGARRQDRRRRRNACLSCGYSLVGNTSGVCPECGTAIAASEQTGEPKPMIGVRRAVRRLRLGAIVQGVVCLPFLVFAAALLLDRVRPQAATYLSTDQAYAHFLLDGQFVAIRDNFAEWMIWEQWRNDMAAAYRAAQQNKQAWLSSRDTASLRDRVKQSVPKPE